MTRPLHVAFVGGTSGEWAVRSTATVTGEPLDPVDAIRVVERSHDGLATDDATWVLRGVVSNDRYLRTSEKATLAAIQPPLARTDATCGRLIPIRKRDEWWNLPQEERRAILEESSRHIAIGLEYLPAIARRLHHSRDLDEPFDFITWFEFAPDDTKAFDELTRRLRATEEWRYVDREIELALDRC